MEALDFFGYLRMVIFGPLLHLKNENLPRGVRKVESVLEKEDLVLLKQTIPVYEQQSLLASLKHAVDLYRILRTSLYIDTILQKNTKEKVMKYFEEIQARSK